MAEKDNGVLNYNSSSDSYVHTNNNNNNNNFHFINNNNNNINNNNNNNNINNSNINNSSNSSKNLKLILKLPHSFKPSSRSSAHQDDGLQQPPAMPCRPPSHPPALAAAAPPQPSSGSRSSGVVAAGKRKFRVLSQGLVDGRIGFVSQNSCAVSESVAVGSSGKRADKIEDVGQALETKQERFLGSCSGLLSLEPDKIPLPPIKLLEELVDSLQKKDTYQVFAEPVDSSLILDYYDIIKEPMDFSTIRKKLYEGRYDTLELFKKDVFQISINAMRYNSPKTIYYKQARAILGAARKALASPRSLSNYIEFERKASRVAGGKKSWKKSCRSDLVRTDYPNGVTLATKNNQAYISVFQRGSGSLRAGVSDDSSVAVDGAYSSNFEFPDEKDALDGSGKPMGWKDGRRPLSMEEYRRSSYKPKKLFRHGCDSSFFGVNGETCQLVALGSKQEFTYGLSLAHFGANLASPTWKYVVEKLQKVLGPNVHFGRGWVGQQENGVSALQQKVSLEPAKTNKFAASSCSKDQSETTHYKRLTQEESKAGSMHRIVSHTAQIASLMDSSGELSHMSCPLKNSTVIISSSDINANNPVERVQQSNLLEPVHSKQQLQEPKIAFLQQTAAQTSQSAAICLTQGSLATSASSSLHRNLTTMTSPLVSVLSQQLNVQLNSNCPSPRPEMNTSTKSSKHVVQGCSDYPVPRKSEAFLHPLIKSHFDATSAREVLAAPTITLGNVHIANAHIAENSRTQGGNQSEKEAVVTASAVAPWDYPEDVAWLSTQHPTVEKESSNFSHSRSAQNSPPDLNVCVPSPATPPSQPLISADSQQPDLALQL